MRKVLLKARVVTAFLLTLVLFLSISSVALAYLYRAPVSITENASTSYDMVPVLWNQNNTWLANNGFMNSTANDTRVQTLGGLDKPWMVADNKTLTAIPVPADSQTNLYFVTGESAASAMDIIVGYGGSITRADVATMELGDNFSLDLKGYIDTAAGLDKKLVFKDSAYIEWVSGAANISAGIAGVGLIQEITDAGSRNVALVNWVAQTFTVPTVAPFKVTTVEMRESQAGGAGENITLGIRAVDGAGMPTGPDLTSAVAAEVLGPAWVSFDVTDYELLGGTQYAIVVRDLTDQVDWHRANADTYAGGAAYTSGDSGATWAIVAPADDMDFKVNGFDYGDAIVTATGITSGIRRVVSSADTANLTITAYDSAGTVIDTSTVALGGASVPDNGNAWYFMDNSATDFTPYWEYYKHTVDGTLIARYEPNTIVVGTNLPDREVGASTENATITWGANPSGVGVTLGSMTSSGQPSIGVTSDTSTRDILPIVGSTDWRPDAGVSATLQANPLRPIVTAISDNTTLSEYQVWVWFGIILVVFIIVLVGANVRGHHLITGIAASAAIIMLVVWTVFPMLSLLIVVLAIVGGLISERSPSL